MHFYNRNQIQCFLHVVELAHFTRAAGQLNLTPTAVSKQIKKLEQTIGEQLFLRSTRKVQLTEFGLIFYKKCKQIEDEISSVNQFIESNREVPQGVLRILVSTITAKDWILNHLSDFLDHYPQIELEIDFSEEDAALARPNIDIMVGFPVIPPATETLKYRKMYSTNNLLCASKAFIQRYGKPIEAEDLPRFKIISHSLRKPAHFLPLASGGQLYCGKPILYMNQFSALNQACLNGIGMFLTGDILVEHWLRSGELVHLLPQYQFRQYDIYMFYRAYDFELPKIRVFLDFFTAKLF
jgi:DNA-binding transcriptional LysR family regulator